MRRELLSPDYPVHIIRRGARGLPFSRNDADRWRNLQTLFYLNDSSSRENWLREVEEEREFAKIRAVDFGSPQAPFFSWPESWPERDPLVSLSAFTFVGNHDHFIMFERQEGGVSKFMQKCGISAAKHFNEKYEEKGAVFQGAYKLKVIDSDIYLKWVAPYVMVKNTFEMHPRGYDWAVHNFDMAWQWSVEYPFSSIGNYMGKRNSLLVDTAPLKKMFGSGVELKRLCKDMIFAREGLGEDKWAEVRKLSFE